MKKFNKIIITTLTLSTVLGIGLGGINLNSDILSRDLVYATEKETLEDINTNNLDLKKEDISVKEENIIEKDISEEEDKSVELNNIVQSEGFQELPALNGYILNSGEHEGARTHKYRVYYETDTIQREPRVGDTIILEVSINKTFMDNSQLPEWFELSKENIQDKGNFNATLSDNYVLNGKEHTFKEINDYTVATDSELEKDAENLHFIFKYNVNSVNDIKIGVNLNTKNQFIINAEYKVKTYNHNYPYNYNLTLPVSFINYYILVEYIDFKDSVKYFV